MRLVNSVQKRMVNFGPFMDRRYVDIQPSLESNVNACSVSGLRNFATGHSTTNESVAKVP